MGGDLENLESNDCYIALNEPSTSSRRCRSERHLWLEAGRSSEAFLGSACTGGNDETRVWSKHGRATTGSFVVSSSTTHASWRRPLETRKALGAPGRPSSRPKHTLSI
jgi:hypothetical protein